MVTLLNKVIVDVRRPSCKVPVIVVLFQPKSEYVVKHPVSVFSQIHSMGVEL
jgi:hypothetical protein